MFKKIDWSTLVLAGIVALLGIFTLASTEIDQNGVIQLGGIVTKQIIFIIVGLICYFIVARIDYSYFKHWQISLLIYLAVLILLVLTLIVGPVKNGARRWLVFAGNQIQPSEFAKIAIVIFTASILQLKDKYKYWVLILISFVATMIYAFLLYLEPHGTMMLLVIALWLLTVFTLLPNQVRNAFFLLFCALIGVGSFFLCIKVTTIGIILVLLGLVVGILMFTAGKSIRKILIIGMIATALLGTGVGLTWQSILSDYWKQKIEAYLNPTQTNNVRLYNVLHSKIAIGSGRVLGKGFGLGTESNLNFLPEHQTDFIFATYAEQFGFIGSIFLLLLYGLLFLRIFFKGLRVKDPFGGVIIVILGLKMLMEMFINVGTNTGVIPATGIPLPLFSAGGTIMLATLISLGIIQSISSADESIA